MSPRGGLGLVAVSIAAVVGMIVFPSQREVIALVWAFIGLGAGLGVLNGKARQLLSRRPSPLDRALLVHPPETQRPADLERLERTHGLRAYEPDDFDHYVRPAMRRLIVHRLRHRHGIELPRDEPLARAVAADELIALAGRTPASTLYGRVLRTDDIERLIRAVEEMR